MDNITKLLELMEALDKKIEIINVEYNLNKQTLKDTTVQIESIVHDMKALKKDMGALSEQVHVSEDKFECTHVCNKMNPDTNTQINSLNERMSTIEHKNIELATTIKAFIDKKIEYMEIINAKKKRVFCCMQ